MIIAKALVGRASCVWVLLAVGFGARIASAQSDVADASGVTFTLLHSFHYKDDAHPNTALVQATNGDLYALSYNGPNRTGTIFKITPGGRQQWRHGLQNHADRHADDALQLLLPDRLRRR